MGYPGNYEYYVRCINPACMSVAPNGVFYDISISPDDAAQKAIEAWNERSSR